MTKELFIFINGVEIKSVPSTGYCAWSKSGIAWQEVVNYPFCRHDHLTAGLLTVSPKKECLELILPILDQKKLKLENVKLILLR